MQFISHSHADIENNFSTVLELIKSEGERQKEDNSRKEAELVGLVEDIYNQYQSLDGHLTRVYMRGARRRIKRASSLSSCSSLDSEYFSSDGTEVSDFSSRISQREHYSPLASTVEALETQNSTETNELEAKEVRQMRAKNGELEKALSELHVKLKNNEERAMSKSSDMMALIEEKVKRYRNEASKQKKEFTDKINVMQQNLESERNKNADIESQLEKEREKVSQYLIKIKNLEDNLAETVSTKQNLAETVSTKQNLLKEKECFVERIKELESQCSKEKDLEEELRDAMWEITVLHNKKCELKLQNEQSQKECSEAIKKLTETVDLTHQESKHFKMNAQLMERRMEELAEGVRQQMEDNIRILHRRVHVTELLNNENKDSYKSTKQKYEEESKMFGEKIAEYEDEIRTLREKVLKLEADMSEEGEKMNLMKTVTQLESKMMKMEKKLKEKDDELVSLGENKKEAIRQLESKMMKMEKKLKEKDDELVSLGENKKESVRQLESKMMKMEKKLKEKDDELVSLGENKKEAIRQLCFLTDFHRDRCLNMKDLMLNMRIKNIK